jgi:glycerophosphoryl diester phosphodiesterase
MTPPRVIAHRGDSAARPENTLAAFAAALEAGADVIELDVQLTRDRHAVVIHDPTLERTTSGRGAVADLSLAELRTLSAGYPERFGAAFADQRVPTLLEALAFLHERARVVIEIKHESAGGPLEEGVEAQTLAAVHRTGTQADVALLSFDTGILTRCRALDPQVPRGHLFFRASDEQVLTSAAAIGASFILPEKGMLTPSLVTRARAAGLRVGTWLVDDPEELPALRRYDLFGIGTNRPGVMLEALGAG